MNSAIIVAAGGSRRMGFDKLSAPLGGRPVLGHSLLAFERCADIAEVIVVTAPDREPLVRSLAAEAGLSKLAAIVPGGAERHLSVWNGLQAAHSSAKTVAVHDGARPLVTPTAISRCLAAAAEHGAASLAHPIADTLKRADADRRVVGSVSRDDLWAMETPQCFETGLLRRAYERILDGGDLVTDEVSAVEALGEPVFLVENPEPNPKITYPADLALAEAILAGRR
ncbi:MAG: 2-C-methyl-D-erythritol 4-phosphate cytidylyltransferase [Verrucomicrobiae bacterium]|nr:2-C-methyl-D-erythritol 4-phosphate cytidylyltransferase [Verrucomicrobiae bacterium]MCP5540030.1 2-C-methyl-D-erythritol 4-phosphate cytidylyltransferase [Akkermansiaceae bacterium]